MHEDVNAPSTMRKKDFHWETWLQWCVHAKYDPDGFAATDTPTDVDRRDEEKILIDLLVFAAENRRAIHKSVAPRAIGAARNTPKDAAAIVATVRERSFKRRCRAIG